MWQVIYGGIRNLELGIYSFPSTSVGADNNCIRQLTEGVGGGRMRICPETGVV